MCVIAIVVSYLIPIMGLFPPSMTWLWLPSCIVSRIAPSIIVRYLGKKWKRVTVFQAAIQLAILIALCVLRIEIRNPDEFVLVRVPYPCSFTLL